jgi:acyl-CoA thioesterase FadM
VCAQAPALLAEGHTVHASLDRNGKPRRLPERVRQLFTIDT